MAKAYRIQEGNLVVLKKSAIWKYWWRMLLRHLRRLGWGLFSLIGSGIVTYLIYQQCISPVATLDGSITFSLSDSITTGALFATFGSAVIGVFTLFATQNLELFYENLAILNQDLASQELAHINWKRWPFIPRMGKLSFSGKSRYSGVNNASICFSTLRSEEIFPLPTTQAEFQELPILQCFLRMKLRRKSYLNYLDEAGVIDEYPVWDCICAIYKSILLYRFSYFCIYIAACFVLHSIVFSFFYSSFYELIIT